MSEQETPAGQVVDRGGEAGPVARVETDRYCDECGYNLYLQPVTCDEHTRLLVTRCPECGRFHAAADRTSAGRGWLRRLAPLGLLAWVATVILIGLGLAITQTGITYGTLEELTTFRRFGGMPTVTTNPRTGTVQTTMTNTTWRRIVREPSTERSFFLAVMFTLSALVGFLLVAWAAITMPHWRRWAYLLITLFTASATGAIAATIWAYEVPNLQEWAVPFVIELSGIHLAAGVLGAYLGRPFVRLMLSVVLVPRVRPIVGYLWLADGKPLPGGEPVADK